MIEAHFGDLDPCTEIEVGTAAIADVKEFGIAVELLQMLDDVDCTDTGEDQFGVTEVETEGFAGFVEQHAFAFFRHDDILFSHSSVIWLQRYKKKCKCANKRERKYTKILKKVNKFSVWYGFCFGWIKESE